MNYIFITNLIFILQFFCNITEGRILSICYHPTLPIIAAGSSDSCLRAFSTTTHRILFRSTLDTLPKEDTLVWALKFLPDGTIVTGDSLGAVCFWSENGTMRQRIKSHAADVLCLAAGKNGDVIYSSGIDRKVIQYRLVDVSSAAAFSNNSHHSRNNNNNNRKNGNTNNSKSKKKKYTKTWVLSGDRRYHSHDVRALALCESKPIDSIVSGGVDTILTVSTTVSLFPTCKQIRHTPFPQRPLVSLAKGARLLLYKSDTEVKVWSLGCPVPLGTPLNSFRGGDKLDIGRKETPVADIKLQV